MKLDTFEPSSTEIVSFIFFFFNKEKQGLIILRIYCFLLSLKHSW